MMGLNAAVSMSFHVICELFVAHLEAFIMSNKVSHVGYLGISVH